MGTSRPTTSCLRPATGLYGPSLPCCGRSDKAEPLATHVLHAPETHTAAHVAPDARTTSLASRPLSPHQQIRKIKDVSQVSTGSSDPFRNQPRGQVLADLTGLKPPLLPEDNPADLSYFFDDDYHKVMPLRI